MVYGVFFYCPSDNIHDSPFAANLASLAHLPINTSYASSTSINISGIIRSTLSPSCVASTLHQQNHTRCPKLRITKRNHSSNQESFLENQFSKLKSKKLYFWQYSLTVILKSRKFCMRPNIEPRTVAPTKKPYVYVQSCTLGNTDLDYRWLPITTPDTFYKYSCYPFNIFLRNSICVNWRQNKG